MAALDSEGIGRSIADWLRGQGRLVELRAVLEMLGERGLSQTEAHMVVAEALNEGILRSDVSELGILIGAPERRTYSSQPPSQRLILLVDDDRDIRNTVTSLLEERGMWVVSARHGKEALRLLVELPRPSLLVVDLMMPVMNGWELLEVLRKDGVVPEVPVVVVSAMKDVAPPISTRLVWKPLDFEELVQLVEELHAA